MTRRLSLTLACSRYDRTRALEDGRVRPEGIELTFLAYEPMELFARQVRYAEFDVAEYSLGAYLIECSRGASRFTAIPVFPSRAFRHGSVYIRRGSGIERPQDLKGKRVGVPDYTMTAALWLRGLFQDEYGVRPEDIHWFVGGLNEPGGKARFDMEFPGVRVEQATKSLNEMLVAGELDALFAPKAPRAFGQSPEVLRLWPDYRRVEQEYYQRTGIFPIMHVVVIKKEIYDRHPWVGPSLFKAFVEAKALAEQDLQPQAHSVLKCMLPWSQEDYESTVALMGQDFWPYGVERNREVFETAARYAYEQGMAAKVVTVEEAFPANVLEL